MEQKKSIIFMIFIASFILLSLNTVSAMRNPAAAYCEAMDGIYLTEADGYGDLVGTCKLNDEKPVDAWDFLKGSIAINETYCAKKNMTLKVVEDYTVCSSIYSSTCAVCVNQDGKETEVTKMMGLSFAETTCGDGHCGFPEDSESCPKDCSASKNDMFCDSFVDGKCDPDCLYNNTIVNDPDCPGYKKPFSILSIFGTIIILIIIVILSIIIWFSKIRKRRAKRRP